MPLCPTCNRPHEDGKNFCRHCGAALPKGPAQRPCPHCGAMVDAQAAFCRACGSSVTGPSAPPPVRVAPPPPPAGVGRPGRFGFGRGLLLVVFNVLCGGLGVLASLGVWYALNAVVQENQLWGERASRGEAALGVAIAWAIGGFVVMFLGGLLARKIACSFRWAVFWVWLALVTAAFAAAGFAACAMAGAERLAQLDDEEAYLAIVLLEAFVVLMTIPEIVAGRRARRAGAGRRGAC